jgi:hypothetical protein
MQTFYLLASPKQADFYYKKIFTKKLVFFSAESAILELKR